jgi:hypothetical protein
VDILPYPTNIDNVRSLEGDFYPIFFEEE